MKLLKSRAYTIFMIIYLSILVVFYVLYFYDLSIQSKKVFYAFFLLFSILNLLRAIAVNKK